LVFVVKSDVEVLEDVHSAQKKSGGIIFAKEASDGKLICGDFYPPSQNTTDFCFVFIYSKNPWCFGGFRLMLT